FSKINDALRCRSQSVQQWIAEHERKLVVHSRKSIEVHWQHFSHLARSVIHKEIISNLSSIGTLFGSKRAPTNSGSVYDLEPAAGPTTSPGLFDPSFVVTSLLLSLMLYPCTPSESPAYALSL